MRDPIKRFLVRPLHDDGGNVATMFGLCMVPAILVAGAAIDYSRTATQWSNLQQATDATALTVAHAYLTKTSTAAGLNGFAQTYLNGLMNGAQLDGPPVLKQSNTVVCVNTVYAVPTTIMKIANFSSYNVRTTACSQVGQTYEVALAVDNSGSMNETDNSGTTKISALQSAAKTLVSILVPSGQTTPQVAMSIVPFNSLVNVGATAVSSSIMDSAGRSSIHWQNFLRPSGGTYNPVSKFDLLNGLNVSWGGCFEELPPPYTTTDTDPTKADDASFVPYFAPDEPGDSNGGYSTYKTTSPSNSPYTPSSSQFYQQQYFLNSYLDDSNGYKTTGLGSCTTSGKNAVYGNADAATGNVFPQGGMTMVCKYGGGIVAPKVTQNSIGAPYYTGPNLECVSKSVQPLTTDPSVLNAKIGTLVAGGSTNLATGFMWGWRSMSPNVKPFPVASTLAVGPQNPKSYDFGPPANQKVIILMTDGTNSWAPALYNGQYTNAFGSYYESFGYFANNRISSYLSKNLAGYGACSGTYLNKDNSRCALDQVTMEACNNAKAKGIIVYTIGFSVPSDPIDSNGQKLLTACASTTSKYFLASDAASLNSAFQAIASSILSLRLTQ